MEQKCWHYKCYDARYLLVGENVHTIFLTKKAEQISEST